MKKINDYWVDENNNKWWCGATTKEQAILYSESLIDCHSCCDCYDCSNCRDCRDCSDCSYCSNCGDCRDCSYCSNCDDCRDCSNCSDCSDCSYYQIRPMQYVSSKIGSRNDQTTFYYGKTNNGNLIQVVCGCFCGDLKEFEAAVLKTHADNDIYREQYFKEIEKVKVLFDLEPDKEPIKLKQYEYDFGDKGE